MDNFNDTGLRAIIAACLVLALLGTLALYADIAGSKYRGKAARRERERARLAKLNAARSPTPAKRTAEPIAPRITSDGSHPSVLELREELREIRANIAREERIDYIKRKGRP